MWRKYTAKEIRQAFFAKIDVGPHPNGCKLWIGGNDGKYGVFRFSGVLRKATHVAWFYATGKWPKDKLCHTCDNPPCVNVDHLFEGTHQDNIDDAKTKGRMPRGSANGAAKITESCAKKIIRLLITGHHTHHQIGRMVGATTAIVGTISNKRNWRHLWPGN